MSSAYFIKQLTRTPELVLATALFQALRPIERVKVRAFVAMMAARDPSNAFPALEWLRVIDEPDHADAVNRALDRMALGEWE